MFHPRRWPRLLLSLMLLPGSLAAEEKPLRQTIDASVRTAWQREKVTPVARADDATFLRRVYLDLVGVIPTADEVRAFLADTDAAKRDKVIDRLLADPRFAAHQADVWDLVLFGRNPANGDATRKRDGFKKWLTDKFAKNEPYDRWSRDLLLAEQEGSELFYVQFRNAPEDAAVAVSRIFLGTQLQCARCHNHPFESWTQRDFYGMAGFFVRLVVVDGGMQKRFWIGEKSTGEVLFSGAAKDQKPGLKGEPVKAKFLNGSVLDEPTVPVGFKEPDFKGNQAPPKPAFSRKEKLAAWVTAADNPYFARAAANRVWAQFMGRGLSHPVDDISDKNQASHPELLQALEAGLKAHKFDLKWLIRELVSSETYQLAGGGPSKAALPPLFERARIRPLSAEELLASIRTAGGSDVKPQGDTDAYFLRYFGEPTNGLGDFQGSLSEHLFLNHASNIRVFFQRKKGNLADTLATSTEPWEKRVELLYLATLGRLPKAEEQAKFVKYLTADAKSDARIEDAIWVLLNSPEFRFNH
jgi:hypothetical protein